MNATRIVRRRPGVTLTEVLVAIFIMALGLMALLTLFPLGALNMAQAIKDDRTANSAANSAANARAAWKLLVESNGNTIDPNLRAAMMNGGSALVPGPLPDRNGNPSPSYPLYLDPVGYYNLYPNTPPGTWQTWLAGVSGSIPRRPLPIVPAPPNPALLITATFAAPTTSPWARTASRRGRWSEGGSTPGRTWCACRPAPPRSLTRPTSPSWT